jgi:hypothetical protein
MPFPVTATEVVEKVDQKAEKAKAKGDADGDSDDMAASVAVAASSSPVKRRSTRSTRRSMQS